MLQTGVSEQLHGRAYLYRIEIFEGPLDCKIIDAGVNAKGSVEAGLIISEICLGGLGKASLHPYSNIEISPYAINVFATEPVLSCLGSQYAGWSLSSSDFFSLGSAKRFLNDFNSSLIWPLTSEASANDS